MEIGKQFDVFLSYNSQDKTWVIKLKDDLIAHDIKVWLDQDEIRPGDVFAEALEKGLQESKAVALIITPASMNSGWVKEEYYRALDLATNNELQLIPVLYKDAEIPGFLKNRNWVDFSDDTKYTQNMEKLIWGITGEKKVTGNPLFKDGAPDGIVVMLEAMGYEVLERKNISPRNEMLICQIRLGIEKQDFIVSVVHDTPSWSDYEILRGGISRTQYSGFLVSLVSIPNSIRELAEVEKIRTYSYDELVIQLVDFKSYLANLVQKHEKSDINRYYTDLNCILDDGKEVSISKYVNSWLMQSRERHLSVLGSFGSGKTWFCQNLIAEQAKACLENLENRIPILINLRDYSKAYDIVQVITDFFANHINIKLPSGYATFDFLNKEGRFLLVFDGLDEMEQRVSDYKSNAENFAELSRVAIYEKSKVILTSRTTYFRDQIEENDILIKRGNPVRFIANNQIIEMGGEYLSRKVVLRELSSDQIKEILSKRLGSEMNTIWNIIQSSSDLFDLARRPSLIDMLIRVIPEMIQQDKNTPLNLTQLFDWYIQQSFDNYNVYSSVIDKDERMAFLEGLSWKMFETQETSIESSVFPELVNEFFDLKSSPEHILFYEKSLRSQSYLVRDENDNYSFAHKSFMEFFVARKVYHALKNIVVTSDTHIGNLDEKFLEILGKTPYTVEIRNFVKQFIQGDSESEKQIAEKLNHLIIATKSSYHEIVRYLGGNAISILHMLGYSFRGKDLSQTILKNADLRNADLTGTIFKRANLYNAIFSNAVLNEADFSDAHLDGIRLEKMKTVTSIDWSPDENQLVVSCEDTNIKVFDMRNQLKGGKDNIRPVVLFGHDYPVISVSWSPSGQFIASIDSERNIIIWNSYDFSIVRKWDANDLLLNDAPYQITHISRQIFFSQDEHEKVLIGNHRLLIVLDFMQESAPTVLMAKGWGGDIQVGSILVGRGKWLKQVDWKIQYANGRNLTRLQHKNIVFERRGIIATRGSNALVESTSPTDFLPEKKKQSGVTVESRSELLEKQSSPPSQMETLGYVVPDFENSRDAQAIPVSVSTLTSAVYSKSGRYLACGAKSKVFIISNGETQIEFDLSLSCDDINIVGAKNIPDTVLLALDNKGVELDHDQRKQWRKAKDEEEEQKRLKMHTGYLDSSWLS